MRISCASLLCAADFSANASAEAGRTIIDTDYRFARSNFRGVDRKTAGVAVKIEHRIGIGRITRNQGTIVALIEIPAGFLAAMQIGKECKADSPALRSGHHFCQMPF